MRDELQKRLMAYLDAAERGIREAGPVVGGELEALVREFMLWRMIDFGCHSAFWLVALGLSVWCWVRAVKWVKGNPDTFNGISGPPVEVCLSAVNVVGIGLTLALGWQATWHAGQAVKVKVAPRVVVLEEVSRLVKPSTK